MFEKILTAVGDKFKLDKRGQIGQADMSKDLHFSKEERSGVGQKATSKIHLLGLSAFFVLCGISIWVFPLFLSSNTIVVYLVLVPTVFLFSSIISRNRNRLEEYFQILFAFFISSFANSISYSFGGGASIEGKVINVVISTILIVTSVITLSQVAGNNIGELYLTRGRFVAGLIIGSSIFFAFLFTSVLAGTYLFGGQDLSFGRLISWAPFIFIFVLANAIREELWFRGLFLKKYASLIGPDPAILVQAVVFSIAHVSAQFSTFAVLYLMVTFFLGLGFGVVMQKTNSILGSVLFHAGSDIPVILAVFSLV